MGKLLSYFWAKLANRRIQGSILPTEGLKIYNGFQFDNEPDRKILAKVLEKFDEFTLGQTNETY